MTTSPPRRARARLALVVAGFLLAQVAAVGVYRWVERERERGDARRFASERIDAPASPIAMSRADGTPLSLESLRGRPVLLHFWATWCAPCRTEIPTLLKLAEDVTSEITVLAVALDDDPAAVRSFFEGEIPTPVVLARASDAERAYGVSALPDTYLLDAGGISRFRLRGPQEWDSAAVREDLSELDRRSATRASTN